MTPLPRKGYLGWTAESADKGRKVRWGIIGEDVMDPIAAGLDDMTQDMQDFVSGFSWGEVFVREGLLSAYGCQSALNIDPLSACNVDPFGDARRRSYR